MSEETTVKNSTLPKKWKADKLISVIDQFIVPQRDRPKIFNGNVPWCRIEDIDGIYLSKSKSGLAVSQELIDSMPLRVYPTGTVIVSCSADLGRCAIISVPLITNQTFIGLVPSENIDSLYLYYLMGAKAKELNEMATGATIKYLSKKKFQELVVPIPPLPEQKQIVSILDKAFAAIDQAKANAEQNLQNAKELFESYLQKVFENKGNDWEEKPIKEVTSLVTKGSSPKWQGINYVEDGGIFFLTSKNVGEGELLLSNKKYLEEEFNSIQKASILEKGDVLTNIVGASIGRTAIFELDEVTNINQAVCLMRCREEKVFNYYLMYLLNSPFFKTILHDNEVDNARANLSLTFFKNLIIPLPSVPEQIEIVEQVRLASVKCKKLQSIYTQKLHDLEELKKSILQKAFSGQLTTN